MPSGTSAIMTTHTDQRNIHMMAFFHRALYSLFLVCILSSFASAEVSLYEGSLQVKKTSGKTCDVSELRNSRNTFIAVKQYWSDVYPELTQEQKERLYDMLSTALLREVDPTLNELRKIEQTMQQDAKTDNVQQ